MSRRIALVVALGLAASAAAQQVAVPSVLRFDVEASPDGVSPDGATWRSWIAGDPSQSWSSTPATAIGAAGSGRAWIDVESASGITADRVVAIEQPVADPDARDGMTAAVAVARAASPALFAALPPVQLAHLQPPQAGIGRAGVDVIVAPLFSRGLPVLADAGLDGWDVLRCSPALDACTPVAFVASSSDEALAHDAAPNGSFRYALSPRYAGGVSGPMSPASGAVDVFITCDEPSALDRRPGATPLRVARAGASIAVTWEARGCRFDLLSAVPSGRPSFSPLACGLGVAAWTGDDPRPFAAYVAVARSAGEVSSLGRDSAGTERVGTACP